jgi:uncharacterized protein with GYD domain
MAKYLVNVSYTVEGVKGLVKDGGSARRAAARAAIESLGGKLEAFYFAFGESDVIAIFDAPDNVTMSALALTVGATGAVSTKTTVLLTPEEVDQVVKKTATYKAPGK